MSTADMAWMGAMMLFSNTLALHSKFLANLTGLALLIYGHWLRAHGQP